MRNNKHSKTVNKQTNQFNANPIQFILGLCVILGVSSISVQANDNPAQAAARVALAQKMSELDQVPAPPSSAQVTPSQAVVKQPGKSSASVTGTVSEKAATAQTAPSPTTPVTASTAVAPVAVAHGMHGMLSMLVLMLVCFVLAFLLLKFLLQYSRRYSSNED